MSEQVKVAVVGCGYWGPNLVRNFHQLPTADLVSCCDTDPQKLEKIEMTEPLRNECAHFIECVRTGARPRTDGENGLRIVKVLEAAQASLDRGGVSVEL